MAAPQSRNAVSGARAAMMRHEVLATGVFSGIAGGVAMIAVAAISATMQGLAPVHALEVIGASFFGVEPDGVAAQVAFGSLVHLATAASLGVLFAAMVPRDFPTTCAMGVGVGFALFALGLMMSLIVPWANPGLRSGMQDIGGSWVIAHAIFGLTLGTAPALRRRLSRAAADAGARVAGAVQHPARTAGVTTRAT